MTACSPATVRRLRCISNPPIQSFQCLLSRCHLTKVSYFMLITCTQMIAHFIHSVSQCKFFFLLFIYAQCNALHFPPGRRNRSYHVLESESQLLKDTNTTRRPTTNSVLQFPINLLTFPRTIAPVLTFPAQLQPLW